jgi:hypothetical protein
VQQILSDGLYLGAVWTEGSPNIEETIYWLNLLIDTTAPICGNAAQRMHGMISNDGPKNIVDSVDYIISRVWADAENRNRVGAVLIAARFQALAAEELMVRRLRAGGRWIRTSRSGVRLATVYGFRPSWGRSTGARSSEQLPASANRSSYRTESGAPLLTARIRRRHTKVALSAVRTHRGASVLDRLLKRRRLRRNHRWQLVHDRPEPSVGFGLRAAVPSRRDEIVDGVIAGIAQGPHEGFRLVEMAHPVVTTVHDMNGDVPQSGDIVENIVVIAICCAAGAKESAIDHVVDENPGRG